MTGIFILLSGVVLANNSRFGNVIVLQNLAHDIALSMRQAQVYGIAVRGCNDGSGVEDCAGIEDAFALAYGVHFTKSESRFELFADVSLDAAYQPGETVLATTIGGGYSIDLLCRMPYSGGSEDCSLTELNVIFIRPEPDACIDGAINSDLECVSSFQQARIVVRSNRGDTAEVAVWDTGQISAQ